MKTYVLMVSKIFPTSHPKKGKATGFPMAILAGEKIHTLRKNYQLWKERIDSVNRGEAILSVRSWQDKPYRSKQEQFVVFGQGEIGIQRFDYTSFGCFIDGVDSDITLRDIARNDGLSLQDFCDWFPQRRFEECAIIHFSASKYSNNKSEGSWFTINKQ